jgi:hypothetical protein
MEGRKGEGRKEGRKVRRKKGELEIKLTVEPLPSMWEALGSMPNTTQVYIYTHTHTRTRARHSWALYTCWTMAWARLCVQ